VPLRRAGRGFLNLFDRYPLALLDVDALFLPHVDSLLSLERCGRTPRERPGRTAGGGVLDVLERHSLALFGRDRLILRQDAVGRTLGGLLNVRRFADITRARFLRGTRSRALVAT